MAEVAARRLSAPGRYAWNDPDREAMVGEAGQARRATVMLEAMVQAWAADDEWTPSEVAAALDVDATDLPWAGSRMHRDDAKAALAALEFGLPSGAAALLPDRGQLAQDALAACAPRAEGGAHSASEAWAAAGVSRDELCAAAERLADMLRTQLRGPEP